MGKAVTPRSNSLGATQPLRQMPAEVRRNIRSVITDFDYSFTSSHGKYSVHHPESMAALYRLLESGYFVAFASGRSLGYCKVLMETMPVKLFVGEDGRGYYVKPNDGPPQLRYIWKRSGAENFSVFRPEEVEAEIATFRRNLFAMFEDEVRRIIPHARISDDAEGDFRKTDLDIDCGENYELNPDEKLRIATIFTHAGYQTYAGSHHLYVRYGQHSKALGVRLALQREYGLDLEAEKHRFLAIGDSHNDQPLFEFFPHSVGVTDNPGVFSNFDHRPRFHTRQKEALGFAEIVDHLLQRSWLSRMKQKIWPF